MVFPLSWDADGHELLVHIPMMYVPCLILIRTLLVGGFIGWLYRQKSIEKSKADDPQTEVLTAFELLRTYKTYKTSKVSESVHIDLRCQYLKGRNESDLVVCNFCPACRAFV
jgi:hypothetical protein